MTPDNPPVGGLLVPVTMSFVDSGQATVLSALIGGAIALLLAQLVNQREDRFRFVENKRLLYARFRKTLRDSMDSIVAVSDRDEATSSAARTKADHALDQVLELQAEIELLGPPGVVDAAADCRDKAKGLLAATGRHAVALQFDPGDIAPAWQSVKEAGNQLTTAMDEFQRHARRDLGVVDRKRRWW